MTEGSGGDEAESMRAGVRARLRSVGRGVRRATPASLVAALCAGALGPVLAVTAGAPAAVAATLGVVGSVGANVLTDVVNEAIGSLRAEGREPSQDEIERELERRILAALEAGDQHVVGELRREIAEVFRQFDVVGVAVEEAVRSGDRQLQDLLVAALAELGGELSDMRQTLTVILQGQQREAAARRADQQVWRRQSGDVARMMDLLARVEQRTRTMPGPGQPQVRWADGCPYRGLYPFEQDQGAIFFGREQTTDDLVRLARQRVQARGLVVVTGASGSGKSSLLRAGLLPAIGRGALEGQWQRLVITPTRDPFYELAEHLSRLGRMDEARLRRDLTGEPANAHRVVRSALPTRSDAERLVLVVDQFEELFTLVHDEAQRRAYIAALHAAATTSIGPHDRPPALVVLGVRGDFWGRCADHPELVPALREGQFVVGPMRPDELRRAITGPAEAAGAIVEDNLVSTILADLPRAVSALPLLSQAMMLTWEHQDDGRLTVRGYEEIGGVAHAIAKSADATYRRLSQRQQELARTVFRRMVIVADGQVRLRRVERAGLPSGAGADDLTAVLEAFTAARLVVLNDDTCEIAHAVLVEAWPRLRSWLQDDVADDALFNQLSEHAREWDQQDRDASFLYRGVRLEDIRQRQAQWRQDPDRYRELDGVVGEFLQAGIRAATLRKRRWRIIVALQTVLLLLAVAGFVNAQQSGAAAGRERERAVSRQLAARSDSLASTAPATASLLAAAAWRTADTDEARHSMLNVLARPARGLVGVHGGAVSRLVFGRDGAQLASFGSDGVVRRWNVAARHAVGQPLAAKSADDSNLEGVGISRDFKIAAPFEEGDRTIRLWDSVTRRHLGDVVAPEGKFGFGWRTAEFTPDGTLLASEGQTEGVQLWDVRTLRPHGKPIATADGSKMLAFDRDGRTLAISDGSDEDNIRLWDVARHRRADVRPESVPGLTALTLSPDATTLAAADSAGAVWFWDLTRPRPRAQGFSVHTGQVTSLAFSPDGAMLASAGVDRTVQLWNVRTRQWRESLTDTAHPASTLTFSPDGQTLATGSSDGTIQLLDTTVLRPLGGPIRGHGQAIRSTAFTPDGKHMISGGDDATVKIWDRTTRRPSSPPLPGRPNEYLITTALSPDAGTLATLLYRPQSQDKGNAVQLWNLAARRPIGSPITEPGHKITSLAFSPDGRTLATAATLDDTDRHNLIQEWDVATQRKTRPPLITRVDPARSMAFSPDGRLLATGSGDTGQFACEGDGVCGVGEGTATTAQIWDRHAQRQIAGPLQGHSGSVNTISFSPDGRLLATGGGGRVICHGKSRECGAMTSAGDDTAKLWSPATGRQVGPPLSGHTGAVTAVAFSPDGRLLATGSADGTARLWDVRTRRPVGSPLTGHTKAINSLAFSPDGATLLTGSDDQTLRQWDVVLPADPLIDRVCSQLGPAQFSAQEWNAYAPGRPLQQPCR
ncbi:hypothetical protein GCM10010411_74800 [Actinomadura fulvescens]|uniref:Novel STAND NTPase 1 domain-containing protein n=1 Tax=Actinomadura fulvescens TaxID=46160 RepID=A0ABN3QHQ3_9ACTN